MGITTMQRKTTKIAAPQKNVPLIITNPPEITEKVTEAIYGNLGEWKKALSEVTLRKISPQTFKEFVVNELQSIEKAMLRILFTNSSEISQLQNQIHSLLALATTLLDEKDTISRREGL